MTTSRNAESCHTATGPGTCWALPKYLQSEQAGHWKSAVRTRARQLRKQLKRKVLCGRREQIRGAGRAHDLSHQKPPTTATTALHKTDVKGSGSLRSRAADTRPRPPRTCFSRSSARLRGKAGPPGGTVRRRARCKMRPSNELINSAKTLARRRALPAQGNDTRPGTGRNVGLSEDTGFAKRRFPTLHVNMRCKLCVIKALQSFADRWLSSLTPDPSSKGKKTEPGLRPVIPH